MNRSHLKIKIYESLNEKSKKFPFIITTRKLLGIRPTIGTFFNQ